MMRNFYVNFRCYDSGKREERSGSIRTLAHKKTWCCCIWKADDTPEQAETLRNQILYLNREDVELEEGTYFIQDLIGLDVIDADNGAAYGTLKDVLQTGANDVYVVQAEGGKELLIPAIPDVIVETNIEEHCMKIRPLEGLLDAN